MSEKPPLKKKKSWSKIIRHTLFGKKSTSSARDGEESESEKSTDQYEQTNSQPNNLTPRETTISEKSLGIPTHRNRGIESQGPPSLLTAATLQAKPKVGNLKTSSNPTSHDLPKSTSDENSLPNKILTNVTRDTLPSTTSTPEKKSIITATTSASSPRTFRGAPIAKHPSSRKSMASTPSSLLEDLEGLESDGSDVDTPVSMTSTSQLGTSFKITRPVVTTNPTRDYTQSDPEGDALRRNIDRMMGSIHSGLSPSSPSPSPSTKALTSLSSLSSPDLHNATSIQSISSRNSNNTMISDGSKYVTSSGGNPSRPPAVLRGGSKKSNTTPGDVGSGTLAPANSIHDILLASSAPSQLPSAASSPPPHPPSGTLSVSSPEMSSDEKVIAVAAAVAGSIALSPHAALFKDLDRHSTGRLTSKEFVQALQARSDVCQVCTPDTRHQI